MEGTAGTPGRGGKPPFPVAVSAQSEGAHTGDPPDNLALYKVGGPIKYQVTSPLYPDPTTGQPTTWMLDNTYPSGYREWELCRLAPVADPTSTSAPADRQRSTTSGFGNPHRLR